jgi:hypothetical protein
MKTLTIDVTDCLYYVLPPLIMFIIFVWYFMKYECNDDAILIFTNIIISSLFTALLSLLYFGVLHLILDYHYTFTL